MSNAQVMLVPNAQVIARPDHWVHLHAVDDTKSNKYVYH